MANSILPQAQDPRIQMLQQFRQFKNNFRGDPKQAAPTGVSVLTPESEVINVSRTY